MTEAEQKIQFNSSNPYLDPIMAVFNSDDKNKTVTADTFKSQSIRLNDSVKQEKFYEEISEFIKKAKNVANNKKPKDKDIEGLQKKKKEILGMVESNYDELLKRILETIDNNNLEAQAEQIKKRINEDKSINKIDEYNLTILINETVELEKVSNELSSKEEYSKKVEEKIKQNKSEILSLVGDNNAEFKNFLDSFIAGVNNNEMFTYVINNGIKKINETINPNINNENTKAFQNLAKNDIILLVYKIDNINTIDFISDNTRIGDKTINNKIKEIEGLKKTLEKELKRCNEVNDICKVIQKAIETINTILQNIEQMQKDSTLIKANYLKLHRDNLNEKVGNLKIDDSEKDNIRSKINNIQELLTTPFNKAQEQQKKKKEQQKTKITQAINNCEKQRTQLELALDTPIACCFNIKTDAFKKAKKDFNKGLCPILDKPKTEEVITGIQNVYDIVKQVINTNEFKKFAEQNATNKKEKNAMINTEIDDIIKTRLKECFYTNQNITKNNTNVTFESSKVVNFLNNLSSFLSKTLLYTNDNEIKLDEVVQLTSNLIELSQCAYSIDNNEKEINNKFQKIQSIQQSIENNIKDESNKKNFNDSINSLITDLQTLTAKIQDYVEINKKQKEQLTWNKIYIDRANSGVAQQQDCIKAIQDISKDNSQTINKVLIKEVISDDKNYEGLTKIHGTDHNEAQNTIDITEDTITISEKNKIGNNVKPDKTIPISDYIINEKYVDKESGKRINLLKSSDNRPTNELAALLSKISNLKDSQPKVYKNATKRIANLIKEKVITEQIKDGETIKNEFPNTPGGVVISALKNLYDTHLDIIDTEEKAVGKTFGDVMVQLKVLMGGEKYKSDFEEKVNGLIKSSKEKVEQRKKEEQEKKEQEEKEKLKKEQEGKASEYVKQLFEDYDSLSSTDNSDIKDFNKEIQRIEKNLANIETLEKEIEECKKKFEEGKEFADVENVEISVKGSNEKQSLTKDEIFDNINKYKKTLNEKRQLQINILRPTINGHHKRELLKKAEELTAKVAQQENIDRDVEQLEKNIDDYNELVEKHNDILNPDGTEDGNKIKPIVSNEEGEYKKLLIAIETAKYEKKKAEEQQKQQEEEEARKKEEETKKLEEEKKKKGEELKNKAKEHLETIKCKIKQQQDEKEAEVEVLGDKDIIANQKNIEDQIGEVGTYYGIYNPIIRKLKEEENTIQTLEGLDLSKDCGVAELIDVLEGFEKNVKTLGSDEKYFKEDEGEDKGVKHNIFAAQQTVVENINECFNQGIFARKPDNIDKDSKKQALENLIKQGQYINSLVENVKKVKEREKQPEGIGDLFNDDNENNNRHKYNDELDTKLKEIKDKISNSVNIDNENNILKQIFKNEIKLKNKEENKEGEAKQPTIENTENINIDEELEKLKEDTKKLNEELLTVNEIEKKVEEIKKQYETITEKLENPNEKIIADNYDKKTIEQTIQEAKELQQEIEKFTAENGVFKDFKGELGDDFDKDENDNLKSKLDTLLEAYEQKNKEIKDEIEKKKKEDEEKKQKKAEEQEKQKKQEIEELANNHTKNKKKQKLIEDAKKDKEEIEKEETGYTALKTKFDKKEEIKAGDFDKKPTNEEDKESEKTNEQTIQENIKTGEELLEKLNKFKDDGEYKDILNEANVKLDENINTEEFENALNEYKNKYKEEKKKQIEELLNKENATEQDINNAHKIFKKFEEYYKDKINFTETVKELKTNIKDKKKGLIIQKIPELLKTTTNDITGRAGNSSSQLKSLIGDFKKDFEGVDDIDKDIKEINEKIKGHIDNLLKIDEKIQVVKEEKLQEAHDILQVFKEEFGEDKKTEIENKINNTRKTIFDEQVKKTQQNEKDKLENKIKSIKEEIEKINVMENNRKEANEKIKILKEEVKKLKENIESFNESRKTDEEKITKVKIENNDTNEEAEEITIDDLDKKLNKKIRDGLETRIKTINDYIKNIDVEKEIKLQQEEENKKDKKEDNKTKNKIKTEQSILKQIKDLREKINEYNEGKTDEEQITTVTIEVDGKNNEKETKEITVNDLEINLNKQIYLNEKNRIEGENKKINNGLDKENSDNVTTIRTYITENSSEKKEFLDETNEENLKKADDYLLKLIQLKKDANKYDEKTKNETYKKEQLTGYNTNTNIQNNVTNKINNIKDGIFKTHKELLNNRINTITEKHNNNKKDLKSLDINKITDDNLKDDVLKINNVADLLKNTKILINDIKNTNKLINEYNSLDDINNKEETLDTQINIINEFYSNLQESLDAKLNDILTIVKKQKETIQNNDEKSKNKKNQQPVDYKKLKNACLILYQVLEHKFEGKDACQVLKKEEQKLYVDVCMILGYINALEIKETGIETNYIESFKYYHKALKTVDDESYKDKDKDKDKGTIVDNLTKKGKILEKAEKEVENARKPLKKNEDIKQQTSELKKDIEEIKKEKDGNEKIKKILELNIVDLSNEIQQKIEQLPSKEDKKNKTTPTEKEVKMNNESIPTPSSSVVTSIPVNSMPPESLAEKQSVVSSAVGNFSSPPPGGTKLDASGNPIVNSQQSSNSTPNESTETENITPSKDSEEDVVMSNISESEVPPKQIEKIPTPSVEEKKDEVFSAQTKKQELNDTNEIESTKSLDKKDDKGTSSILEEGPKPATGSTLSASNKDIKEQQGNQDSTNKQQEQTKRAASKQNTNKLSQQQFMITMMIFNQILNKNQQNKSVNPLNAMFNSPYFMNSLMNSMFGNSFMNSMFGNNFMNNMLFNNLSSSLNAFNLLNGLSNQIHF